MTGDTKQSHMCQTCFKTFSLHSYLLRHNRRQHAPQKPLNCDICGNSYISKGNLKKHMFLHTGIKALKCEVCMKHFSNKSDLKKHIRVHTGEKPFRCHLCSVSFTQIGHLKAHMFIHTGEKPYQCDLCFKKFSLKTALIRHFNSHAGHKPYQCNLCEKFFSQPSHLKDHKLVHSGKKNFKCDICKRNFTTKNSLKKHYIIHTGEKPYECDVCNKAFKSYYVRKNHVCSQAEVVKEKPIQKVQSSKQKLLKCKLGSQTFTVQHALQKHTESHNASHNISHDVPLSNKTYPVKKVCECEVCYKIFPTFSLLECHKKVHGNEGLCKCNICGVGFTTASMLVSHMHCHKAFQCKICLMSFGTSDALDVHHKRHNSNFICEICGFCFATKLGLKMHKHSHEDKKAMYQCELCCMPFTNLDDLKIHRSEDISVCAVCSREFCMRKHMAYHMCTLHGKVMNKDKVKFSGKVYSRKSKGKASKKCIIFKSESKLSLAFKSPTCHENFSNKSHLHQHQLMHCSGSSEQGIPRSKEAGESTMQSSDQDVPQSKEAGESTMQSSDQDLPQSKEAEESTMQSSDQDISQSKEAGESTMQSSDQDIPQSKETGESTMQSSNKKHIIVKNRKNTVSFECSVCLKKFTLKQSLNQHQLVHQKENQDIKKTGELSGQEKTTEAKSANKKSALLECPVCLEKVMFKTQFHKHQMMHLKEDCNKEKVKFSGKTYTRKPKKLATEENHAVVKLEVDASVFECPSCFRKFCSVDDLGQHQSTHQKENLVCGNPHQKQPLIPDDYCINIKQEIQ